MFHQAVQQHDAVTPRKTLAQQLFPSSSPGATHGNIAGNARATLQSQNTLQPSPSSAINIKLGSVIPMKRTASQSHKFEPVLSNPASVPRTSTIQGHSKVRLGTGGGIVGRLHDGVYFDENDFVNDAELDLDEDSGFDRQISTSKAPVPQPPVQDSLSPVGTVPSSNVPLDWSSSPPTHENRLDTDRSEPRTKKQLETADNDRGEASPKLKTGSAAPRSRKRGTLPWLKNQQVQESMKGPPAQIPQAFDRSRRGQRKRSSTSTDSFTLLPKDNEDSHYLWNKSASALKDEQKKKKRQQALNGGNSISVGEGNSEMITASKRVPRRKPVAKVFLSQEQRKVLDLVAEGKKSVFFTGSAGTGKSVLLREIINVLRQKHNKELDRVAVTASTGLAACNVGGITLHSFGGIGLGKESVPELVKKIKRNQKARNRWIRTKVLVIDEISMVDGDLFDKLEGIARIIRNNGRPFGGIQLVITGDFFQLPPVPDYGKVAKFAFDAATWTTSIDHTIGLTQVFRQKDPVFANMLNEMRLGNLSQKSIAAFHTLNRPLNINDNLEATELFPTRTEVDNANNIRMKNLKGLAMDFTATDGGLITDTAQRDKLLSNCMAPQKITLKEGAQVMLIKNMDESLVNGSIGKVVRFTTAKAYADYVENEDDIEEAEMLGLSHEAMEKSRSKIKSFMGQEPTGSTSPKWPMVKFLVADGTTRQMLLQPELWKIELPNGEIQASRLQVPLILSWALSIHKAQGQTLERVKVDLGKIFEKGQAYVALSRATSQEGLQISRFDPKKVMVHEKVRNFYNSLYNIEQAAKRSDHASESGRKKAMDYDEDHPRGGMVFEEDEEAMRELLA